MKTDDNELDDLEICKSIISRTKWKASSIGDRYSCEADGVRSVMCFFASMTYATSLFR